MSGSTPVWISEAEVVDLLDLTDAIEALESGLRLQAAGSALNMAKTHVAWGESDTLHAIGAAFEGAGVVGTKTWAHTPGGATPLLLIWDAHTGNLIAVIEAFALGQMRTGAMSAVATRWMSKSDADVFAIIGTGKQALAQLAAVAAVRPLRRVCIWGRDPGRRARFIEAAYGLGYGFEIEAPRTVAATTADASIVTLATRAREAFLTAAMVSPGAHINAIGAITPEREEFTQDVFTRATLVIADDPATARRLSKEFRDHFTDEADWSRVKSLCKLVGGEGRPAQADLTVFKAMGMGGISDLALGIEIHLRAMKSGCGRPLEPPRKMAPRLGARASAKELCR